MPNTMVVVTDSVRARCFEAAAKPAAWTEVACLVNPDGRALGRDTPTDRLPRTNESAGPSRHAIEPHTSLPGKSLDAFARTIGETLERDHRTGRFEHLVLVAAPHLLGVLHTHFSKSLRASIVGELKLDIAGLTADEIHARLPREWLR
ncbi:host attachment protein [Rhodanobacter denitrificans]|uniref:host attachment protein n=1 Tax=Rhodanobacter denitrificans TaxID=666685 RepID=UPI000260D0BA|nr:host attachment protein [Rhodanobacter denitrificans]EIM02492.1 host cell attachment-required protein [Rhodanobacter denitrificans]UJM90043.1 host attachment protein [Rhodanobacter denitrificans]